MIVCMHRERQATHFALNKSLPQAHVPVLDPGKHTLWAGMFRAMNQLPPATSFFKQNSREKPHTCLLPESNKLSSSSGAALQLIGGVDKLLPSSCAQKMALTWRGSLVQNRPHRSPA